jgi:type IV secretion system protein VirD4
MLFNREIMNRYPTVIFLCLLSTAELISALAFWFLGWHEVPYPGSFIYVMRQGFFKEALAAMAVVLMPWVCFEAIMRGGVARITTKVLLVTLAAVAVTAFLGAVAFHYWEEYPIGLAKLIRLIQHHRPGSELYRHFILSEQGAFLAMGLGVAIHFAQKFSSENDMLGNAHFASALEVYQSGFFKREPTSIIIGKKEGAPMYSNGSEHVLVFAPTGSGKTRSIAIPNLFNYQDSIVCNDVKLTLFETTSGYREQVLGHQCYCWAPAHPERKTHRFNPLDLISNDKIQRITDIQRIAHIMIPDDPKSDPIWSRASRKLLKALILFLLDTPGQPTTLGEVGRLIKQQDFDTWLKKMLEETEHLDADFYRNGFSYINNHEKTRSSILETFSGYFELFDDPVVDAATSASDFDIRDLRRKKITIYIGFSEDDMERLSPILTLFWQQLVSEMIREIPNPIDEPYSLLCLIDEFSSLGRIDRVRRSLKLLREYRVRCILMFQYIAQTYEKYSHDEAKAFVNIKTKVAYTTEDISDAEFISKMLGTRTKRVTTRSVSNQQQGSSDSKNVSYQAIPLLRPDEVMKMSPKVSLVMRSGVAPVKAEQFIWYKQHEMKHLVMDEVDVPTVSAELTNFDHQEKRAMIAKRQAKEQRAKKGNEHEGDYHAC